LGGGRREDDPEALVEHQHRPAQLLARRAQEVLRASCNTFHEPRIAPGEPRRPGPSGRRARSGGTSLRAPAPLAPPSTVPASADPLSLIEALASTLSPRRSLDGDSAESPSERSA